MAAASSDDGAEKSRFRWLGAARYTVAVVVTVLIVVVIAKAISVVLRPDTMYVSVTGGSVPAKSVPPDFLSLSIDFEAQNPGGRAVLYYTNITVYLFDNSTPASTPAPVFNSILMFNTDPVTLLQGRALDNAVKLSVERGHDIDDDSFDQLYGGGIMTGVTMRLDGNLITEAMSGINRTRPTTYYCPGLVVGGDPDDKAYQSNKDVMCSYVQGSSSSSGHLLRFCWWFSMLVVAAGMVALIQTL